MDLFDCIQKEVDEIISIKYKNDDCPPKFIVSLLYEQGEKKVDNDHKIILTVIHNGYTFSKIIFPDTKSVYGYQSLDQTMEYLYNRTM